MWNRQQVKEQAKQIMKRNYWKMFVVTLIASILTGEKTTIIERVQDFTSNNLSYDAQPIFYSSNFELNFPNEKRLQKFGRYDVISSNKIHESNGAVTATKRLVIYADITNP